MSLIRLYHYMELVDQYQDIFKYPGMLTNNLSISLQDYNFTVRILGKVSIDST